MLYIIYIYSRYQANGIASTLGPMIPRLKIIYPKNDLQKKKKRTRNSVNHFAWATHTLGMKRMGLQKYWVM